MSFAALIESKRERLTRADFVEWLLSPEGLDPCIPHGLWLKALTHAGGLEEAKRRERDLQKSET